MNIARVNTVSLILLSIVATAAHSGCKAWTKATDRTKESAKYEMGRVYVLQQDVFLRQATDTIFYKEIRTRFHLERPISAIGIGQRALEEYRKDPKQHPEIKGIVKAGTHLQFKYLAPAPNIPLPLISRPNSTDVFLRILDGAFVGLSVEAQDISNEPDSGIWAKVDPEYLRIERCERHDRPTSKG